MANPPADTLYHYCSTQTFISILQNRSVWLSSLRLSNDTMEGKLVNKLLLQLAKEDFLEIDAYRGIEDAMQATEEFVDGLGFCLSADGDVLSQWRGYADDAKGVSIGFSKEYLSALQAARGSNNPWFTVNKVEYDKDKQIELIRPTYEGLKQYAEDGGFKQIKGLLLLVGKTDEEIEAARQANMRARQDAISMTIGAIWHLFVLKSKAFDEEQEWRLISIDVPTSGDPCKFRASGTRVVPYRVLQLLDIPNQSPVLDVVLGPKHDTPIPVIKSMLEQLGYKNVEVRKSEASYR